MTTSMRRAGGFGLWYGLTAGVVFWGVHVSAMAAMTPWVCHSGSEVWYHVVTVATALPTLAAFVPASRARRSDAGQGVRFLGAVGVLVTAISLLAILAEWVPVFILDPCAA